MNLTKKIWQCFGCGAKGNVLDFALLMEGRSRDDTMAVREVALKLTHLFLDGETPPKGEERPATRRPVVPRAAISKPAPDLPVSVNAPLDFVLHSLDHTHPYLRDRGFTDTTIEAFGLGYCSRGLMKGRIVIPLLDQRGQLIGYAGRLVDDAAIDDDHPEYLLPPPREKRGMRFELHTSAFLYHGYAAFHDKPLAALVIVQGFPSVWWLHQDSLFAPTVALMDSSMSDAQAQLVVDHMAPTGIVYIMPNGGNAGAKLAAEVFVKIGAHVPVKWAKLDDDKQPTDYSVSALLERLQPA